MKISGLNDSTINDNLWKKEKTKENTEKTLLKREGRNLGQQTEKVVYKAEHYEQHICKKEQPIKHIKTIELF